MIKYGQKVVAMSERGMTIGYVNSFPFEVPYSESMLGIQSISKLATDEDLVKYKQAYQEQREARNTFNRLISEYQLPMELTDLEFASFGTKIIFYYTAPNRVDFRELLKALSAKLKARIQLCQINAQETISDFRGIGPCGAELCLFIKSLMKDKRDGNKKCNEFYCCLDYKDPFYEDIRSRLPKVGDFITTHTGEMGRVHRLDLWNEEFEMMTNQGVLKRYVSELRNVTLNRNTVDFPKHFESILNETKIVLGRSERILKTEKAIAAELKHEQDLSKEFTEKNFELLFGKK
ncbi:MAG: hypothetical protein H7336_05315 [Bacteriovorax sp.]|nr:hypothetical protein [Bacteriovorax sp.]